MPLCEMLVASLLTLSMQTDGGGETPAEAIRDTVERLASFDRATRLSAEQELLERGPAILEHLPAAEDLTDPAVRSAVQRIRKRLELEQARQALRPGRITIPKTGANPIDGYVSLTSEQIGRDAELSPNDDAAYWPVIDDLARQIDGWPDRVLPDGRMTFRDRTPADDRKQVSYSGAFRLAAGPIRMKPITGEATNRLVRVPLELRSEPRLRPLFVSYAASDLSLVAADGAVLSSFTPTAKYELPFGDRHDTIGLRLDFLATDPDTAGPWSLKGTMQVTVAAAEARFAFPLDNVVRSATETSRGGVTVRVRKASRNASGTVTVELAVVYDRGGPAFESHRTWVYHNIAALTYQIDREGETVEKHLDHEPGFSTIAQADGGVILAYRFTGLPDDAQHIEFVYHAPTRIIEAPIEFTIDRVRSDQS